MTSAFEVAFAGFTYCEYVEFYSINLTERAGARSYIITAFVFSG